MFLRSVIRFSFLNVEELDRDYVGGQYKNASGFGSLSFQAAVIVYYPALLKVDLLRTGRT